MNKEELKKNAQQYLELNEPLFITKWASKLKPHARLIYVTGLILLALGLLGAFVMLFTNPMGALVSLLFVFIEFVMLRMFCEFLVAYDK